MPLAFLFSSRRHLVRKGLASEKQRRRLEPPEWLKFIHTSRFIGFGIAVATLFLIVLLVVFSQQQDDYFLTVGQIAPRSIYSQISFSYPDEEATRSKKKAAADDTPSVYQIKLQEITKDANLFVSQLEELKKLNINALSKMERQKMAETLWNQRLNSSLDAADMARLIVMPSKDEVAKTVRTILLDIARKGIVEPEQFFVSKVNISTYSSDASPRDLQMQMISRFPSVEKARQELSAQLRSKVAVEEKYLPVLEKAVQGILRPNMAYNEALTEHMKELSRNKVQDVMITVEAGDTLVMRGERITKSHLAALKAYSEVKRVKEQSGNLKRQLWGRTGILCLLFASGILVLRTQRFGGKRTTNREYALLATILVLQIFVARFVLEFSGIIGWPSSGIVPYLTMPAFGPILAVVLTNARRANLLALFSSFLLSILTDNNFFVLVYSAVTGIAGVYMARGIRRRFQLITAGLGAGVAGMLCAAVYAIHFQIDVNSALWCGVASISAGLISSLLISSILPLFESTFKVTTDLRWLELTDLNHPLLRKMFTEAPGTYHHSLSVANLAEAAMEAIGGNSLQARVCSLFHDIGKITKPEYFSENIRSKESPHDNLAPNMSALIILAHIKDGVDLALKYHLNREIVDVIQEHQGTSTIQYFYHRAKQHEKDAIQGSKIMNLPEDDVPRVEEETYRYPGPKPQTRESGVISLADVVESASRSMINPTPQKIEGMIREVVFTKLLDGQLDDCSLTMNDLNKITEAFTFTLVNMLHARISYPEDEPEKE